METSTKDCSNEGSNIGSEGGGDLLGSCNLAKAKATPAPQSNALAVHTSGKTQQRTSSEPPPEVLPKRCSFGTEHPEFPMRAWTKEPRSQKVGEHFLGGTGDSVTE